MRSPTVLRPRPAVTTSAGAALALHSLAWVLTARHPPGPRALLQAEGEAHTACRGHHRSTAVVGRARSCCAGLRGQAQWQRGPGTARGSLTRVAGADEQLCRPQGAGVVPGRARWLLGTVSVLTSQRHIRSVDIPGRRGPPSLHLACGPSYVWGRGQPDRAPSLAGGHTLRVCRLCPWRPTCSAPGVLPLCAGRPVTLTRRAFRSRQHSCV